MNENIKVYVKLDENNVITQINSSIFLKDTTDYVEIDEWQEGLPRDKFAHAQGNYLEKGLFDEQGRYNYELIDNVPTLLTDEEKNELFPAQSNEDVPTIDKRVEALESAMLEMILGGM